MRKCKALWLWAGAAADEGCPVQLSSARRQGHPAAAVQAL